MIYDRNIARETSINVAEVERQRDRLAMALKDMVVATVGDFVERKRAVRLLFEITGKE